MNKLKELEEKTYKIRRLEEAINWGVVLARTKGKRLNEAVLEACIFYKQLLSLPKRTIETLEVGDCLDITINDENVTCYLKIDNIETAKEYLNSLKSYEIHQIIPREFLELWGEINGNIQTAN